MIIGLALGAWLYVSATETIVRQVHLVGEGAAFVDLKRSHTSTVRLVLATVVAALGLVTAIVLRARVLRAESLAVLATWSGRGLVVALVAVATIGTYASVSNATYDEYAGVPEYTTAREVVAVIERGGLRCEGLEIERVTGSPYFAGEHATCPIGSAVDFEDGYDDVTIDFWRDEAARERWLDETLGTDPVAVAGPTWLVRCQFRSLCGIIRSLTDGKDLR